MQDNGLFSPSGATISNLDELSRKASLVGESRALEIADLADEAVCFSLGVAEDLGPYEILSMLSDSASFGVYPVDADALPESRAAIELATASLTLLDKVEFVRRYLFGMSARGAAFSESDFLNESVRGERISYVRNQYADEAYDIFSEDFRDPRVKYYRSFKECVSMMESGEVDYVLLPIEERGGVRLPTVAELIYRNELKISAVTPVFGFDLGADMKYALVSKGFKHFRAKPGDDRYLELRIPSVGSVSIAELLSASTAFGMSAYRVNTLTYDTEGESATYFYAVIKDGGEGFVPLLTYLTLFADDYSAVGLYKNLE